MLVYQCPYSLQVQQAEGTWIAQNIVVIVVCWSGQQSFVQDHQVA